jgi:predicted DNA binding CopG/RHH family protein
MKRKKASALEDAADKEAIAAFKKGRLVPVSNQADMKSMLRNAAANYRRKKEARINIRLPEVDLAELKTKAAEEGMPYQTLIASVLHKFVNGRLTSRGT